MLVLFILVTFSLFAFGLYLLLVRVAEVNRRALQELGANYTIAQQAVPAFIGTNMFHTPMIHPVIRPCAV